jgi:hypothetical protein
MWGPDGAPIAQGRWENGELIEPLPTPAGFRLAYRPFETTDLHPTVAAAANVARSAPERPRLTFEGATVQRGTAISCSDQGCRTTLRARLADGRIYEGQAHGQPNGAVLGFHGSGVIWTSEGAVAQSGIWVRGALAQPLLDNATTPMAVPNTPTAAQMGDEAFAAFTSGAVPLADDVNRPAPLRLP